MREAAACTVTCYNALRSAATRSASTSMVHVTTTCASSLVGAAHTLLSACSRVDQIRVLFSQPVLLATMSFFHGSNVIGVESDGPAGGPECERDHPGMYAASRARGKSGLFCEGQASTLVSDPLR